MSKRVTKWCRAFAQTISLEDMKQLTRPDGPFADEMLYRLCNVVGIPVAQGALVNAIESGSEPSCHLFFRKKASPVLENLGVTRIGGQSRKDENRFLKTLSRRLS